MVFCVKRFYKTLFVFLVILGFPLSLIWTQNQDKKKAEIEQDIQMRIYNWHKEAKAIGYSGEPVNWEIFKTKLDDSLVPNSGFEHDGNWQLKKGASITSLDCKYGKSALMIKDKGKAISRDINIQPNGLYDLSFWFRMGPSVLYPKSYATVRVVYLSKGRIISHSSYYDVPAPGISVQYDSKNGKGWVLYEEPIRMPLKATSCRLEILSEVGLEVYFDDVILQPYKKAVYIGIGSLSNPLLVKPRKPIIHDYLIRSFSVDGPPAHIKSWKASLGGKVLKIVNVHYNTYLDYYTLRIKIPGLSAGKHFITIATTDGKFIARGQIVAKIMSDTLLAGIITDQHYLHAYHGTYSRYTKQMSRVIKTMNIHNPDFVFLLGDYDEDFQPPANIFKELYSLKAPVFIGRGNHEYDRNNELKYDKYFSQDKHYFSRVLGDFHFIILAGNELNPSGLHKYTIMTESQIERIKSELENHQDKTTVVFTEPSVFFRKVKINSFTLNDQAKRLQAIFEKYGVTAIIQGDKHAYFKENINGVEYITIPSPTRPFNQFSYAGYGLLLVHQGKVEYLDAVELFHQRNGDPHPPENWDLRINYKHYENKHHLPNNYYSLEVLHIDMIGGKLGVTCEGNSNPYIGLPFKIDPRTYAGIKKVLTGSNGEKYIQIDVNQGTSRN
jgi:predicted phosphodiesterase